LGFRIRSPTYRRPLPPDLGCFAIAPKREERGAEDSAQFATQAEGREAEAGRVFEQRQCECKSVLPDELPRGEVLT